MTFRRRLTLLVGGSVALAIVLAFAGGYMAIRSQLRSEVDASLRGRVDDVRRAGRLSAFAGDYHPQRGPGDPDAYIQLIRADGRPAVIADTQDQLALPVTATAKEVAAGKAGTTLYDDRFGNAHVRVIVTPAIDSLGNRGAIAFGRSLGEVDSVLGRLKLIFVLAALGGVALAVILGRAVAGRATAPLRRLTDAAQHVAQTRDLGRRIDASGSDEIASMATSFNAMLDALEVSVADLDASVGAQRQLVADASHELRTPITSLRTNIEILRTRSAELSEERRTELLDTVVAQTEELSVLMNDVIELARGDQPTEGREPVHVDELVGDALERASRHAPDTLFRPRLDDTVVLGAASRLSRAINNLLDNAVRWNAPGAPIEVSLSQGVLRVRDHGPGVPAEELAHVFDRFFRGAHTRAQTGSGLGLAIVRQVAEDHGGAVGVANAPGGGAEFTLTLPTLAPSAGALFAESYADPR